MEAWTLVSGGRAVRTARHLDVINPSTGVAVGRAPISSAADLDDAVAAATQAFSAWRDTPDAERAEACRRIAVGIANNSEGLAHLLTEEQGKPLNGLGSRFEIGGAVAWARYTAELLLPVEVIQDDLEGRVELHRKPIGVVGSITPWNWPVMIACWHIIPAVRAGNTVVIKPSPLTPLSTIRLVEIINEGLPSGVVNVVSGESDLGSLMTGHPGIAKVTFTGPTATGRKIMQNAAGTLKRLTLELGGNDAGVVLSDADPKQIAEGLFWGAFINSGQTCAALKRLYAPVDLYDEICRELTAYAKAVRVRDGLDEDAVLGPLQNRRQYEIVSSFVDEARAKGGRVLIGGEPIGGSGNFYPITLVANVNSGCRLVDEERFGPALPIIRYHDVEEAISKANASPMGLGGSVWSTNLEMAKRVASRIEAGSVWINKHGAIRPNAPFGGVKQSGMGVEFGIDGLKEFTTIQTMFC